MYQAFKKTKYKNSIIIFDALNTQVETIKYIFEEEAYNVAPIKGNHKILYEEFLNIIKEKNYKVEIVKRNGEADIIEYGFTNV